MTEPGERQPQRKQLGDSLGHGRVCDYPPTPPPPHSENTLKLWCLQSFLSLLEMPSACKTLGQVAWTPSVGVESLRKKVVRLRPSEKKEGKEWGCEIENWWLLISWIQSHRPLHLLWVLCPGFPESFQWVSPFIEPSCRWVPLNCHSDFVLYPSQSLYTSQTQTEAPVCFSTIMSETLFIL